MDVKKIIRRDISVEQIEEILYEMSSPENKERALILSSDIIEQITKRYYSYKFAHNPEGKYYMRAEVENLKIEYLMEPLAENKPANEAYLISVFLKGMLIYKCPEEEVMEVIYIRLRR